ncbi:EAL domain-containing protein [Entomospira nematocerorum]|uniref:PTS sugar transporter subunit IIC/EAL domain-containing protein n=1 Tax=Entomospira nematocerorum TaxID=2719987 RepID=A0A968GC71_9SPIO|nr:EAL domain-containing protein [Entomospira nematocera]NIZ47197.1 PTS sugar transporter subunit IIC/EAL domain-containing protein [Entomospira nematocera]WDI34260.1 EAL domain-containing protein [Entomospira nematocera]
MMWIKKINLMDKIVFIVGTLQRNRYLKSIQQGFELTIPLLIVSSIILLLLNFPYIPYQIWMRNTFDIKDRDIYQIVNAVWVINCISFVMGISYILAESFNQASLVGMSRYRSFLSMIISVTAYLIFIVSDRNMVYGDGFQRFPADVFIAVITALIASRIFVALSSIRPLEKDLHADMSNPVLSRVYATIMPAVTTLLIFVILRFLRSYIDLKNLGGFFSHIYNNFHRGSVPSSLGDAFRYVLLESIYWLFGIDGTMILNDINGSRLALSGLPHYNFFTIAPNEFIFSRTFFAHFVYIGGEGALFGLVLAYWWLRIRTDYDRTIQMATVPVFFNISKLLLYGLPIIANPIFILPFLIAPMLTLFISYMAFSFGLVAPISTSVSWYTPVIISGYLSTDSLSGAILQVVNLLVSMFVYAPFLVLSRQIRDHEYQQGHKELLEFSMNRYVVEESFLNIRTDVVGAAARILSADLRVALRAGQFFLMYQPKINFLERKVMGVEALIRWKHPVYGFISPAVIISIAEENDLLDELSHWVITESVRQIAEWRSQGLLDVHVGVNLSAREINSPYLADFILNTLEFYNVDPHQLEIEIVETVELTVNSLVQQQLLRLVEMGVTLAIDDFGVGHGSAIYLKNFDISTLKVDRAISEEAHRDHRVAAIFNGIMSICNDLKVTMVIEHVETEEQLQYLVQRGGNIFQGYFFSKPLLSEDLFTYVQSVEADRSLLTKTLVSEELRALVDAGERG